MVILGFSLWALSQRMGLSATALKWDSWLQMGFASMGGFLFASVWFCWSDCCAVVWVGSGWLVEDTGVLNTTTWTLLQAVQSTLPAMLGGTHLSF